MFTLKVRWIPFLSTNFYFITCGIFNSATHTVEDWIMGWIWKMNWKGCGRKWLWPNLWYHPGIWQQVLRKLMKILNCDCQWPDWDSNRVLPKYESKALLPELTCSLYYKQRKYNNYRHVDVCTVLWLLIKTNRNYKSNCSFVYARRTVFIFWQWTMHNKNWRETLSNRSEIMTELRMVQITEL
jgi:hypothetical protein